MHLVARGIPHEEGSVKIGELMILGSLDWGLELPNPLANVSFVWGRWYIETNKDFSCLTETFYELDAWWMSKCFEIWFSFKGTLGSSYFHTKRRKNKHLKG